MAAWAGTSGSDVELVVAAGAVTSGKDVELVVAAASSGLRASADDSCLGVCIGRLFCSSLRDFALSGLE